jgi:hypothetical protein
MNTSILRLGIASLVITLAGLLGAAYLRQRQAELRQLEAGVRDELAANRRLRQAWRAEQAKATTVTQPATSAQAPDATRPAPPASNLARGSRLAEELQALPEYAPFQQRSLRRTTLRRYGELFAELKLPKDREERLKQIFDDRQRDGMNAVTTAHQQGHDQASHEYHLRVKQVMEAAETKIAALLNDEERQVLARYEKSALWRSVQQPELDEFVADRGLPPLAPAQRQALMAAAGAARDWKPATTEGKATAVELQRRRNEMMISLAAGALDPRQRAALADYLAFNHTRGEIMGRLYYPEKPAGSVFMTVSINRP